VAFWIHGVDFCRGVCVRLCPYSHVHAVLSAGVLDKTETLTPLGERVSCMSCDPRLGKVLVLSAMFRCVLPMLSVAACLTKDPFYNSMQNRGLVSKVR